MVDWTSVVIIILIFLIIIIVVALYGTFIIRTAIAVDDAADDIVVTMKTLDNDVTRINNHLDSSVAATDISKFLKDFADGIKPELPHGATAACDNIAIILKDKGITLDSDACAFGLLFSSSMTSLANVNINISSIDTELKIIKDKVCV